MEFNVAKERLKKLYEALKKLSPEDTELAALYFIEGYSQVEIAEMQGITKQTLNRKIIRIKNFLKKLLSGADF